MPEVYFRDSDALLHRLLSRKGFTAARRRSLLRRIRQRGSVYLAPLNAVYVRQFRMTSAAEDATRFLHQACRGLPYRSALSRSLPNRNHKSQAPALSLEDAFYLAVFEHALAYFGSRVLHPARPAFRDAELAELYELTHEDLEQLTSLPFADAIDALDVISRLREFDAATLGAPPTPATSAKGMARLPNAWHKPWLSIAASMNTSASNWDTSQATIFTTPTSRDASRPPPSANSS